jgi:dolichyl-phosphate beta-glucosyltransferase
VSHVLSVVIPAHNEARRLGRTLECIRTYANAAGETWELIVVDDGSRDETADIARRFVGPPLDMRVLVNDGQRGKGYSVRRGMLAASGESVLMCDADLSAPIEELAKLRRWLAEGYDVVIGSRDMPDSRLDPPQPLVRRWLAWGLRAVRQRLLLPHIRDTQCGLKLFRRAAAQAIFALQTEDGWLFDCEVLGLAERLGYRIREVGIVWRNDPDSRVRVLPELLRSMPTLLAIRRRVGRR